jgi:anaerobic dimethyl sulfoxide reductase subunit A
MKKAMKNIEKLETPCKGVNRRDFMKLGLMLGAGVCVDLRTSPAFAALTPPSKGEQTVWSNCWAHCRCSCLLKVVLEDGRIKRIESDDMGDDTFGMHQTRACLKGLSLHKRTYAPDRIKYPMRRVGKRGEGKFERISWEEAYDEVYSRFKNIIDKYGNDSIFFTCGYNGPIGTSPPGSYQFVERFLNSIGGFLQAHGNYSNHQLNEAVDLTYGQGMFNGSAPTEMAYSDLIVLFGDNPAATRMSGGGGTYLYQVGKSISRARTIIIDPQYTDTACGREDQWIPVRPGTDAALAEAIAYVLISENRVDEEFLRTHCYGYNGEPGDPARNIPALPEEACYKAYILGTAPGEKPKTPEWAAPICGVPAKTIIQLARDIANARAPFIAQGWGPQRQAAGEQNSRAIFMLPILVGKLGKRGTCNGANAFCAPEGIMQMMPFGDNKIKARVPCFLWPQAVLDGKNMTAEKDCIRGADRLKNDIKCVVMYQGNWLLNQHGGCNQLADILRDESKLEFIFIMENNMTPSAKYADILLPSITWLEDSRFIVFGTYVLHAEPAIERLFGCPHPYDFFTELARRFGVAKQFTEGRSWDEWQDRLYLNTREKYPYLPEINELKTKKVIRLPYDPNAERFGMKAFRQNPVTSPLTTRSGKIEIYSLALETRSKTWIMPEGEKLTPLPRYCKTWEGYSEIGKSEYTLQFISYKAKSRAHSTWVNVPWMHEVLEDCLSINPIDAKIRNIKQHQLVEVFNARGKIRVKAKITPRVMPGVVALPNGTYYEPDASGVDIGHCPNTLTKLGGRSQIVKANAINTCLVEVRGI